MFHLLRSFFPTGWQPRQPSCVAVAQDGGKAAQLAAATGFAVSPVLLHATGEVADGGASRRCCLAAMPGAAAAQARPWNGADLMVFADSMHLVDTHRALQVGRCKRRVLQAAAAAAVHSTRAAVPK